MASDGHPGFYAELRAEFYAAFLAALTALGPDMKKLSGFGRNHRDRPWDV